jgi:hypothetical protein
MRQQSFAVPRVDQSVPDAYVDRSAPKLRRKQGIRPSCKGFSRGFDADKEH